ncbi:aminopeptidase N [Nocardioides sp.]|uniref:aminopeptidase N n=1 Tax=Nocardioides sp. TaxID=35761 RepID=UPI0035694A3B
MTATAQITRSLTQHEAEQRAALLEVDRYDIIVDLTGLLDGEFLESVSTIMFRCREPGASTFVDCRAALQGAVLNGRALDLTSIEDGRLALHDLAAENVLTVKTVQADTSSGAGIMRSVDPSDGRVYVWTSFEADDAQRAWACFDQPDLKAPHRFTVLAPHSWTVTSNTAPAGVEDASADSRRWLFPDTPPLSTYVVVVNAGPFHEIRREIGGHDLGLYCRRSLSTFLERDADELFELTAAGLAFFGEKFGIAFPQRRYDQVFVPDMSGAMENWGCVTWTDSALSRSRPTYAERARVASALLHEMAHMWFGDLVTMRWWDDLWLNEAFASWAATWASASATPYTDAWATFLADGKVEGYRVDRSPASHPIRGEVPDVARAMANFDAITYLKGQSVLKQLVAQVGEDAFLAGLGAYFRKHAWGNTRLEDLTSAIGAAAGQDLDGWTADWVDRAGTDTLTLAGDALHATGPNGEAPRRHHLEITSYRRTGEALVPLGSLAVTTSRRTTDLPELPAADLHLVNARDLTFAAVRGEPDSTRVMLAAAALLPDPLSRVLAVTTAWDMLQTGELTSGQVFDCLLEVLRAETAPGVVEPLLARALRTAEQWSRPADVRGRLVRLAQVATALSEQPELRTPALRTLAASASTAQHFAVLDAAGVDDRDLAWRTLTRRSALGAYDADAVAALLPDDPDPEAKVRALGVLAARPDRQAKAEVWAAVFEERSVPAGRALIALSACFWRPLDGELLVPWAHRYLDEVEHLGHGGGMLATSSLMRSMFPTMADQAFLDRAQAVAADPAASPTLRSTLLAETDTLRRMLSARS